MQKVYGPTGIYRETFLIKFRVFEWVVLLSGCESKKGPQKVENGVKTDPCKDLSGVSKNDIEARTKLGYAEKSPLPDMVCGNCNLHIPPSAGKECGGCMLFKGPVYSSGYCIYWAPLTPRT